MQFHLIDEMRLQNCISYISNVALNKGYVVTIKQGARSLNQNDLWHKWIDMMAEEQGTSPEDMKIAIKRQVLGMREIVGLDGQISYADYATSALNKDEFSKLMVNTEVIAKEYLGMTLPTPVELGWKLKQKIG